MHTLVDEAYSILDESDFSAATRQAREVLKNAPEDADSYLLFAEIADEKEMFDEALLWIEKGLIHVPDHEALLLKKASILIDGFEEIDEAFEILIDLKDRFKNKSSDQLRDEFGEELVLDVYLLLVDCYRINNQVPLAYEYALKAKEIAPFEESAILTLASVHFELGEFKKALSMIEPTDQWNEPADFYWIQAQINCALGQFELADEQFLKAYRMERNRYHRPVRLSQHSFFSQVEQAILAMPREIRDFVHDSVIEIKEIVPHEMVLESKGFVSPQACVAIEQIKAQKPKPLSAIYLFQKNIENLSTKKEEVRDVIASALIHELGKSN